MENRKQGILQKEQMKLKFSKQGFVKEIRDDFGKLKKEIIINGVLYRRNSVYKTYNSIEDNTLLHKSHLKNSPLKNTEPY